jgi:NDP-sugar pyrophosphorylase family protein
MLMAAGLGTRLKPFTDLEPKALLPMMGTPMAQFALDAALAAGVERVVANVHHHAVRAREGLLALERGSMELLISDESQELLGSAGGIRKAAPHFGMEPFFLLNADVLCEVDLAALGRAHRRLRASHGVSITLTVFPQPPLGSSGTQHEAYREILFDASRGLITGLGEKAKGRPFFVGAAVIEPDALGAIQPNGPAEFVPTVLLPAIERGQAGVYLAEGQWHDVGSPALWLQTHLEMIRALETGALPRAWRERIEDRNQRVASLQWMDESVSSRLAHVWDWSGPAYWSPWGDASARPPARLGSSAVLYGSAPSEGGSLSEGIGYGGVWKSVKSPE